MRMVPVLLALAIAAGASTARAAAIEPGDPVPGHPGVTYLGLIRQAVPHLATNPQDHQVEAHPKGPIRHIAGADYAGDPPDPLALEFIQDRRIQVGGQPRILVLADLGADPDRAQDTVLLLLFDDAAKPRLLDFADVGVAPDTEFAPDVGPVSLGPGDDGIVIYGEHLEADVSTGAYLLISPLGDRLALIGQAGVTSAKLCGWSRTETARIASAPDPGRAHPRLDLVIQVRDATTKEDCGDDPRPKPSVRAYRAAWRWNASAGRYEAASSQLKALDALNAAGF
jgi:hypothetical protein